MNEVNVEWRTKEIKEISDEIMEDCVARMAKFMQEHLVALMNTCQKQSWRTTIDLKVGNEVLMWVDHHKSKLMEH